MSFWDELKDYFQKYKLKKVGLVRFELTIDGYLRTTAFTVFW